METCHVQETDRVRSSSARDRRGVASRGGVACGDFPRSHRRRSRAHERAAAAERAVHAIAPAGRFDPAVRRRLIALLDLREEEIERMDVRAARADGGAFVLIESLGRKRAERLERALPELGGAVELREAWRRDYP